ncbi:DotG/IcmE/VirB10 family protein [Stutzerimonas stutzeri]|uniref:DotG/IcmE/VirB10 family protein n=1 Tax=Stutzerimonas stutzeri TaxID=316 RepID=UPI00265D2E0D|nr:DotG/IcmE/VirB10 family protein [Stutzerimonas stutzeri]MCF6783417.1 DotG/IcmE/VirB10 family protein [Stutzerimonas stutzeri]
MESKITDDDLNISVDTSDRLGDQGYGQQQYAGPVRGSDGVKAIFNQQNRKRLFLYAACGLTLLIVLIWVFFSIEEQQVVQGGGGRVQTSGIQTKANSEPSYIQREEAEYYNSVVLPQEQLSEPTAHPVIVTEPDVVNPFEERARPKRAERISEVGTQEAQASATSNQAQPVDYRGMDDLIKSLIEHEGSNTPASYSVEWSYRPSKAATGNAAASQIAGNTVQANGAQSGTACTTPVTRAATMYMATADLALNSDIGGPVSLTIRNGRLSGAQLIGSFERKEEFLRMELNKLVTRKHTLPVSAVGLDMDTTLNAVQGDVNRHIMYRYGWWGLGTTLKAIGKAAEMNADSQVTVTNGAVVESTASNSSREIKMALGSLGEDMGSTFQDRINRPITVSLKVGDEVGIFFLDDVCLPSGSGNGY